MTISLIERRTDYLSPLMCARIKCPRWWFRQVNDLCGPQPRPIERHRAHVWRRKLLITDRNAFSRETP